MFFICAYPCYLWLKDKVKKTQMTCILQIFICDHLCHLWFSNRKLSVTLELSVVSSTPFNP